MSERNWPEMPLPEGLAGLAAGMALGGLALAGLAWPGAEASDAWSGVNPFLERRGSAAWSEGRAPVEADSLALARQANAGLLGGAPADIAPVSWGQPPAEQGAADALGQLRNAHASSRQAAGDSPEEWAKALALAGFGRGALPAAGRERADAPKGSRLRVEANCGYDSRLEGCGQGPAGGKLGVAEMAKAIREERERRRAEGL